MLLSFLMLSNANIIPIKTFSYHLARLMKLSVIQETREMFEYPLYSVVFSRSEIATSCKIYNMRVNNYTVSRKLLRLWPEPSLWNRTGICQKFGMEKPENRKQKIIETDPIPNNYALIRPGLVEWTIPIALCSQYQTSGIPNVTRIQSIHFAVQTLW